jgi:hypothetical protein
LAGEGGVFDVGLEGGEEFFQGQSGFHAFLHEAQPGLVALYGGPVLGLHRVTDVVAQDQEVDVTVAHASQVGFGDLLAGCGGAFKDPGADQGDACPDGFFDGGPLVPEGADHGAYEDG